MSPGVPSSLTLQCLDLKHTPLCLAFSLSAGNPNSGPHVSLALTLSTEPESSLQPWLFWFCSCFSKSLPLAWTLTRRSVSPRNPPVSNPDSARITNVHYHCVGGLCLRIKLRSSSVTQQGLNRWSDVSTAFLPL